MSKLILDVVECLNQARESIRKESTSISKKDKEKYMNNEQLINSVQTGFNDSEVRKMMYALIDSSLENLPIEEIKKSMLWRVLFKKYDNLDSKKIVNYMMQQKDYVDVLKSVYTKRDAIVEYAINNAIHSGEVTVKEALKEALKPENYLEFIYHMIEEAKDIGRIYSEAFTPLINLILENEIKLIIKFGIM